MLFLAIGLICAWLTLFGVEWLAKRNVVSSELSRKIPHIIGGLAIALSPFFLSMRIVVFFGVVFLLVTLLVIKYNWFPGARSVDRLSWGEPFFAIGVTVSALITSVDWIFAAAILHLALADAFAALVGKSFLGKHGYKVFGHNKTVEGSLAFMLTSMSITYWVVFIAPAGIHAAWPVVLWLPFIATLLEAVTPFGLDNLFLPVVLVVILNGLR